MRNTSDKFRFWLSLMAIAAFLVLVFGFRSAPEEEKLRLTRKVKTIKIVNKSGFDIHHIYVTGNNHASWGEDILENGENQYLRKGESKEVELPDCGKWDVKIISADGKECISYDVELCASDTWEADC